VLQRPTGLGYIGGAKSSLRTHRNAKTITENEHPGCAVSGGRKAVGRGSVPL